MFHFLADDLSDDVPNLAGALFHKLTDIASTCTFVEMCL